MSRQTRDHSLLTIGLHCNKPCKLKISYSENAFNIPSLPNITVQPNLQQCTQNTYINLQLDKSSIQNLFCNKVLNNNALIDTVLK